MRFRLPGGKQQDLFAQIDHAKKLAERRGPLDKLAAAIDFELFRPLLMKLLGYEGRRDKGGNAPFDPVFMFKVIVLQKYHGLSEEQVEIQISDRFSFLRFLGIAPGDEPPDKNTVWDFKESLGEEGLASMFEMFDRLLAGRGIHGKEGIIVDASFVDVPRQRNSRDDNAAIKRGETPPGWEENPRRLCQKDLDARWTKKNQEVHYGYKNHVKSDVKTKLVRDYRVTPASTHDSQCFEEFIGTDDRAAHADSAYRSKESLAMLKEKGIAERLCEKGTRGKPLDEKQKERNRAISHIRARGEHVFGTQSWQMKADKIRTIGLTRAAFGIGLGNLVYNFVRLGQLGLKVA